MPECYQPIYLKSQDIIVACGKCLNCQTNKKREIALRTSVEIERYKYKHFICNTYNDLQMPRTVEGRETLRRQENINFIKNLDIAQKRQYRAQGIESEFKYLTVGEYSPDILRPHYHTVIGSNVPISFNAKTKWDKGLSDIQDLISRKAISYTAGYTQKKLWDKTFEGLEEPFHAFSRGIGKLWFEEKWENGEINVAKYYIETQLYRQSIGTYYKYLLRKKYYDYNQDEITQMVGKASWRSFQRAIEYNIEKNRKELDKLNEEQIIRKYGYGKSYNAIRQGIYKAIQKANELRKTDRDPRREWDEIVKTMKACKHMRELKKAKYEAEAKYWLKLKMRDKVA